MKKKLLALALLVSIPFISKARDAFKYYKFVSEGSNKQVIQVIAVDRKTSKNNITTPDGTILLNASLREYAEFQAQKEAERRAQAERQKREAEEAEDEQVREIFSSLEFEADEDYDQYSGYYSDSSESSNSVLDEIYEF